MATVVDNRTGGTVNRTVLWGGAALMCAGGALCATGAALCGVALAGAVRRWVRELEEPPSQMALRKWTQAKAATRAGIEGWNQPDVAARTR
jgi:hypothetical protein